MSWLIIIVFTILSLFLVVFFSPTTLKAAITGAPFLPTPKKAIRKAMKIANLGSGEILYDLGCGTGKALIIGAKEFGAKVVGVEYSTSFFIISKINLWLNRIKNGKIYRQDFLKTGVREADVVFMFLTPKAFPKLQNKFTDELKAGARIITFSSPLGFWQPQKIVSLSNIRGKLYFYVKH